MKSFKKPKKYNLIFLHQNKKPLGTILMKSCIVPFLWLTYNKNLDNTPLIHHNIIGVMPMRVQMFEEKQSTKCQLAIESSGKRLSFEIFKSNICHYVKDMGDIDFLINTIKTDKIYKYLVKQWYREALYLLGMVDYLCRENDVPLLEDYNELRRVKLNKMLYPAGIIILCAVLGNEEPKAKSLQEAIPEFLRHNIVESEVRNIA